MSRVLQASTTQRGKPSLVDINNFSYTTHGSTASTQYWRCAQRKCGATLTTRKSTGNLVGENLPSHNHGNKLMRKVACITEKAVVSKYAKVHGATPAAVICKRLAPTCSVQHSRDKLVVLPVLGQSKWLFGGKDRHWIQDPRFHQTMQNSCQPLSLTSTLKLGMGGTL